MKKIAGIDPGKSGGLAIIHDETETPIVYSFSNQTCHDIAEFIRGHMSLIDKVYIEKVSSMPGQGVKSMFTFGEGYGHLQGVLNALLIPYDFVRPLTWQSTLKCRTGGDKNISKAKAQQLFPMVEKITHAIADALLIAEYGNREENRG